MKLKTKTAVEHKTATMGYSGNSVTKAAVVSRAETDKHVMYVGNRIKTSAILSKVVGMPKPKAFEQSGFLLVKGNKPGVLLRVVKWDGKDLYTHDGVYGTLSALNSNTSLKAEIVSRKELINRAIKFNRVLEVTKVETKKRLKVALINPFGELYIVGIEPKGDRLAFHNMEPVAAYNKKAVQYTDPKDVAVPANKFLAEVIRK